MKRRGEQPPHGIGTADPDLYARRTVYAVAALLAAWAFVVSYSHIYDLGLAHAQHGIAAKGMPLTVDLLIVAASLVLWVQKREDAQPHGLARFLPRLMLWAGIGGTVAANIGYGLPSGWESGVLSAWPGAVFAGVVEMVMVTARPRQPDAPGEQLIEQVTPPVPATSHDAAEAAFAASVAGGNPLTEYQLHKRYGIPRSAARKIAAPAVPQSPAVAAEALPPQPPPRPAAAALNGSATRG